MGDRSKQYPYAHFRSRLVQKAPAEKKRMEIDELQKAAYQSSALPATHCYSSDISRIKSGLWSGSEPSWRKLSETSKTNENQKSLHPLSKEFVSFSSFGKTTEELETNIYHVQPSRIPSPPFLLDHIENEDQFLYDKCDSSPAYQTRATSLSSFPVRQSPVPKKTESGGWSDDDDLLPVQSGCSKTPADFTYGQENVATKDLKFSRPTHTWKKYEQTESTNIADVSKNSSRFDVFQDNSPEFLKPKVSCNKELSRTLPHISKLQNKNDYFGLIPSSDSTSKPSIRDIASLLKNLKLIQALRNQNVEPEALLQTPKIDDMSDNLAPKPLIRIQNQITLNLKNKTSNSTSGTEMLLTQKDCTSKSQVSEAVRKQSAYDNQNTAAMFVSQFLQKLSTKQGNREICQKAKHVSKTVSNTQKGCSGKNSSQGKAYEKESSHLPKKFGTDSLQKSTLSRTRKRSTNSDYPILECSKKSRGTESLAKKHWSQGDTEEQSNKPGKLLKGSLKKESFNIKEGGIRGILKVKAQDKGPEELSFGKTHNENSSDISTARFDKSPREKSHDMCSRRWSRSPRRKLRGRSPRRTSADRSPRRRSRGRSPRRTSADRSPRRRSRGRSPRRTSADRTPRRKSLGRSPRKRSRSRKRSADRSPERRSRSCKRRSRDRSPRHKSCGRTARMQSCSRRRQSADRTPEKQPCDRSPHKGPHSDGLRRLPQNNSTALCAGKNPEIKTETNKISKQLQHENNPDLSPCGGESLSSSVRDQRFDKNLEMLKKKKNACDRDSSPQSPMIPSPENIRLGDFLRKKDHNENKKSDMRNKHTAMAPCVSKEIKTKCDPVDSAEILALQHEEENSDGKSVALKQFSEKKVVKKSPKVDPTSTDSLSSSLGAVNSSHSVQPELLQLAPTAAPVTSEPCSQYSEPSVQNYQAAYQPSAYGDVADPSTYSYYMNTLPYMPYSGYDTSSYNMYTSQYPMENQLQQSVCYSDYYAETPVPHKQIPVFNPTVPPQENHLSKKALRKRKALPKKNALPKKECRRQAVLVQVDSSTHDTSNKSELIVEKRSKSRIGERDKGQSNKKEENEGQVVKEKYPGETRRDKNEDRIDTKATGEDRSEKKGKGECETEKEDRRYDKSEHKGKESQEDVITPDEERELLSCKAEVQKQMENLNSEYITMSKLSAIFTVQMFKGEMMRKMCHEKDGHKDHIITAYGRLQDEIKVQLANLTSAVKDIDKELRKKVSTVESSTPRIEGEFSKKSLLAEKITKGKFLSTMVEVIPENAEFYDPGGHWCQSCNKLVPTVCAMLLHLKSEEHKEHMDHLDRPWFSKSFKKIRNRCEVDINKSYPIKGVQFVMPVDGFYCSLCKLTFPDSSVAEDHIGGREHNAAYKKLITENPIYERRIILDRLAGVAIIHKEEYKRRLEAEKELANKKKRQEEEEEEQTFGKANGKNKEEVDHLVSSKASLQSERKNAIKLTLLENKKIKCGNRSAGDGKPKQTIVYIGRAPNYKPRTHEHFSSKASRSADGTCNMDSSPERNLFQNVLEEDQNFKKDLPVEKSQDVVSDQKDADNSDPYKNLRKTSYKICENTSEAPNSASEQRSATGHDFDDSRNARGSFVLVPAVLQNSSVSTGQPADNLKAKEVCSQNIVTADLSTASKTDRLTAPPRSSEKNNAKGQTKKTAVQIHGPLTEEEADLLLLGINKDDQLPLAIPKPPPSVISSKSNVALPTEITDTQQGITEPTTENIHAEPYVATHLSSVTCSGAVCATSQASNTLSSVVSKIPTIPICPVTHAGVTTAKESQDQSLAYYPSFQITTAKIQGNTLQKSNTTTVQAIVSQKTSITSIESNISHRPGISTVESNILENPQNQNSTVCTQSCSVMQGSISHSPDVTCVKIQTEFGSSLPVTCTSDAQSNLLTSADVEKPCKGALKGQETFLYPTVFSSVLSNTCGNIGNSLESSQENIQGSTPPPPVADNCPSKSSDNADVLYNVSLEPPNMNYANKENVPAVQQGSVIQQEFAPISCNVSLIPTSFPPAEQPKSDPHTQTSPVEQENVTQQLVASYSTDIGSNTVTSLSSPKATSVRYSDHYKSSPVPGKISETSANPSNIQNPPSGQGTVLLPLVTSCVSSSVQSNGALENISHPPPVAVQGDAPLFPLPNLSTSSPANLIAPGIVPQPPQNVSYPRQSAPLIQGNVMQQQTVNCNPAIPGIPPLENVPCPPVVRYPPNLRGNSAVLANISHPPPNIRLYHNQSAPNVPGNNRKQSLQRGHCIPAAPGNISQPPPNMNHPQNQLIQLTPGDVSKSPPVIHPGNICVPPVPGTIFHSRNQCGSMILSSVSQPPPDISCTGTHPAPPVFGSTSQSPPRMSHCGPGIPGNVSHPPGLQNTVSGQISLRPHFSNYGRVTEPLNVPMQPSIYSTLPGQCIPVSINSVSDSSPNSTKNHIPAKIESSQGEVKSTSSSLAVTESKSSLLVCGRGGRQSREWSDVQNSEQVVSLLNKVHVTSVSVTTSSEEKSVKYQYLSCGTNSFHPAPPGTEPVPILQSSSLSPEKDPSTSQELSEHISEKIESHLEVGVEISVANETSKTDSVVSFDECVEQCLGVNTSVCSEKLGGNAQDVKSKDLCCHPKSQEKCSDLENDTVLGFDCTMSTRSESLDLSPDKAGSGKQSIIVTTASTRSLEFSGNKNSGFCGTSQDVLTGGLLVHGSITNQKVTRLPSTSVKNMPETSQLENATQENKNCFHTESKELKESTNTAQNNDLVYCGQNFNLHSLPLFKIPNSFQQHGSVSTPAVSSFNEGPSRIVPLPESSLNPAPPGTNSFHESQRSITANNELQKPTLELYINPSSSFPTSTYEKPVQSAEKDTQVTVTKESDAFSSLPPELVSTEKASTVVNSSVSFTLEQVHTKNAEPVKIHVDGTDNTVKVCTAEELINHEIRFITENTDKHICISSSSNPFSRRLKCEAQKTDSEVRNVAENYNNCNGNIANQNSEGTKISQNVPDLTQSKGEVIKSKYIMKPENFAKGQNKNSFNVQSGAEDHTQQLPAGSSPCDFLNNNTVFSTQSNTVHNFSPWLQSSSCQMHSSSPHLVSVPSSSHQSFTKHRLTPQSSDFLNPPPPGTEPLSDFQIAQNCESPQSTLGHSKGSQGSVSNKFSELVSEKVEMSVVSLDISKEFTEESNVSTCASRQSQNDFMKMESPLVSAEDVVRVTPNVNAKSAEAWEMCGHPINIVVKSHPSDQYDEELGFRGTKKESSHATESSEPETQHVNVPSKGDSPGHSRKSETSTSEEQDKTEESAPRVPSAESKETFEGMEVSSHC